MARYIATKKEDDIMKKVNLKKMRDEIIYFLIGILGIVIFICNVTKNIPENWNTNFLSAFITFVVAYGFLIGPFVAVIGFLAFWEVRNDNSYFKK